MRCSICDNEIEEDHVSFDAYCGNDIDEKETLASMFDAIASAHPRLEFDMKMCAYDGDSDHIMWVKFFSYKDGKRTAERKSKDIKDKIKYADYKKKFYRYSLPLDTADALAKGGKALENLLKDNTAALFYIPKKQMTKEICLTAVKHGGLWLEFVPKEFKTEEVCLAAVRQNKWALKYVPKNLQEKVKKALKQ